MKAPEIDGHRDAGNYMSGPLGGINNGELSGNLTFIFILLWKIIELCGKGLFYLGFGLVLATKWAWAKWQGKENYQ